MCWRRPGISCIDHFKQLNDRFGHDAGDEVLKAVAQLFRQYLRQHDIACRTGGEEFLLILPHTNRADAFLPDFVVGKTRLAAAADTAAGAGHHFDKMKDLAVFDGFNHFADVA